MANIMMPGHVTSTACRPGNDLVPFRRVVGAVCVRVVRRLLGIRRYQIGGQNNFEPSTAGRIQFNLKLAPSRFVAGMRADALRQCGSARSRFKRTVGVRSQFTGNRV